ncbi:alpha/beta hydrolase [Escherichia coli]|uniref:alpha/beta hydrolase n=1 Tax=Escherichia coli TaxID=562 RepID=UPI00198A4FC3|nr:alpha/beta hydrolase [Escherichia coli]MCX2230427.1 alpha/beta hydrolase [Escherichia coli]HAN9276901.1 alpha/beta hydrolase [Escherichia coli]HEF0942491.1 alpha/beta hydrolase [Escherichia coli]
MKKLKFTFKNAAGEELAGLLELPENPKAFALLAHCFTCGKDLKGAARIARKLTEKAIAGEVPEAKAIVTIGSPGELTHVKRLFKDDVENINQHGAYPVELAGRVFTLKKQMLDNIQEHKIAHKVFAMNKPLLIFHATEDDTVLIEQAEKIFKAAKHPKSFISLGKADHLLTHAQDAEYVADIIISWSECYL